MKFKHRVEAKRSRRIGVPQPKDEWRGGTFCEATGEELQIVWNGVGPIPGNQPWPDAVRCPLPARLNLRAGRA